VPKTQGTNFERLTYDRLVTDRFLRACRGEATDTTPVWFLRQTGRYLPAYRELRARHSLLELCSTPELAARLTVEPVRRLEVDAALLFTDLAWPLVPMGLAFEVLKGEGPQDQPPAVRTPEDVTQLRAYDPAVELRPMLDAIRLAKDQLPGRAPLVAIAGAPLTLASYALDGARSNAFIRTKALLNSELALWRQVAERLAEVGAAVVEAQVDAGAEAVVVFDSFVAGLDPETYRAHVGPHTARVLHAVRRRGVPVVHYAPATGQVLREIASLGADAVGVDWRVPLDEAWELLGPRQAIMGNLDPTLLLGPVERLLAATSDVLERADRRPGHIFNLGHGLLPSTPLDRVQALARYVHAYHAC
jgi:uroporphyrinogen decarboxylase